MKIAFSEIAVPRGGALVVGVLEGRVLTRTGAALDKRAGGALARAMKSGRFTGAKGQFLELLQPAGLGLGRVLLAGLGKAADIDDLRLQALGGGAVSRLNRGGEKTACIAVEGVRGMKIKAPAAAAHVAFGARLGSYRFDRYRTKEKADKKPTLGSLTVMVKDAPAARRAHRPLAEIAEGVFFTRDLVSEPANVIYPASLSARAGALKKLGVAVEVLGRARMQKLGMGALLGVAQGSAREPRLVVMRWTGGRGRPVVFVGKGVTFDTGGISIKPSGGMEDMKWDMGGAGVVIGLMRALAGRKAKLNAIGVVGLVENMPSATAQRPGDVVTTMSGQTIEVINTDAEGRLVLADALWYAHTRFKPKAMIDLATLTGAIIVALGHQHAGLLSNDDDLADALAAAGSAVGERLWRLPLDESYDDDIKSDIADMRNVGRARAAGSISAAKLLERFVGDVPWAHLDIAAVTWSKAAKPTVPKGGTAFGVRLLDRLVADRFEAK